MPACGIFSPGSQLDTSSDTLKATFGILSRLAGGRKLPQPRSLLLIQDSSSHKGLWLSELALNRQVQLSADDHQVAGSCAKCQRPLVPHLFSFFSLKYADKLTPAILLVSNF